MIVKSHENAHNVVKFLIMNHIFLVLITWLEHIVLGFEPVFLIHFHQEIAITLACGFSMKLNREKKTISFFFLRLILFSNSSFENFDQYQCSDENKKKKKQNHIVKSI